jgi:acid-sensing ion channel, other
MKAFFAHFLAILKDYCMNSSLAGLSYIADRRYHFTERIFWLGCVILSWIGSIDLIVNFMNSYYHNSVSMGVISLRPMDEVMFPSAGVCELGYTKEDYKTLEVLITRLKEELEKKLGVESIEYNYDVEDFMTRVVFHNLYNYGSMWSYCKPYEDCEDCIKCPKSGYQKFADHVRANCSYMFEECAWNGVKFDCCHYFKPVRTSVGTCYLLNSIQTVKKNGPNWLDMKVGRRHGRGNLQISVRKSNALYILSEEDIPHMLMTTLAFPQIPEGFDGIVILKIQDTFNDKNLRGIPPLQRKCVFPDEPSGSAYRRYSYTTCVTECLKVQQIRTCNCTHFNMIVDDSDKSPICDHNGLICLDKMELMYPQTVFLQPWHPQGMVDCQCLPSCNEPQISVISKWSHINDGTKSRKVSIKLHQIPTQRYFRQAVREELDIIGEF